LGAQPNEQRAADYQGNIIESGQPLLTRPQQIGYGDIFRSIYSVGERSNLLFSLTHKHTTRSRYYSRDFFCVKYYIVDPYELKGAYTKLVGIGPELM